MFRNVLLIAHFSITQFGKAAYFSKGGPMVCLEMSY